MPNPYQPPHSELKDTKLAERDEGFIGGWVAILAIGAACGAGVMSLYFVFDSTMRLMPSPFWVVGLVWFAALTAVSFLIRGTLGDAHGRFIFVLITLPIGYLLYVPVCSAGALVLNGGDYRVTGTQTVTSSLFSFAIILLAVSMFVRTWMVRRQRRLASTDSTDDETGTDSLSVSESPSSPPSNERSSS